MRFPGFWPGWGDLDSWPGLVADPGGLSGRPQSSAENMIGVGNSGK